MIPGDKYTCYCSKCKSKNEVIEYMAAALGDVKYTKQEQQYMDHFNKSVEMTENANALMEQHAIDQSLLE